MLFSKKSNKQKKYWHSQGVTVKHAYSLKLPENRSENSSEDVWHLSVRHHPLVCPPSVRRYSRFILTQCPNPIQNGGIPSLLYIL